MLGLGTSQLSILASTKLIKYINDRQNNVKTVKNFRFK